MRGTTVRSRAAGSSSGRAAAGQCVHERSKGGRAGAWRRAAPRHDGSAVVSRTGASVERRCHIQAPNAAPPIAQVVRKMATSVPEPNRGRCSPGGESSIDLAIRPVHFAPHERPLQRPVAGEPVPVGLSARLRQVACLILDVTKRLSLRSRRTRRSARCGDRCEGRAPRGAPTPLDAQILLLKERRQP